MHRRAGPHRAPPRRRIGRQRAIAKQADMQRTLLVAAAFFAVIASANAQTTLEKPECNAVNIAGVEEKIAKMKDGPQKQTASTEIEAAKAMLSNKKTEDCQTHLLKATLQTK